MKVKDFKTYLDFYKDEQEVNFKLPSGLEWAVDENKMTSHNVKDLEKRENCSIYLK